MDINFIWLQITALEPLSNILKTRDSVISGYPNSEKRVRRYDAQRSSFDEILKHKKSGVNGEAKSSSIIINRQNLYQICANFVNLMNY